MIFDLKLETVSYKDCTMGRLWVGDKFECFTLELPWRQNLPDISCYPSGLWEYKKRISPSRKTQVIEILGIPNRIHCQIHAGNFTSQIQGCTLVGDSIRFLNGDNIPDVANSKNTLDKVLALAPNRGNIKVIRHGERT